MEQHCSDALWVCKLCNSSILLFIQKNQQKRLESHVREYKKTTSWRVWASPARMKRPQEPSQAPELTPNRQTVCVRAAMTPLRRHGRWKCICESRELHSVMENKGFKEMIRGLEWLYAVKTQERKHRPKAAGVQFSNVTHLVYMRVNICFYISTTAELSLLFLRV